MTMIARSDDLRVRNRHRVMTAIRRAGNLSRTDIARITGLSAATVTAIASELVEQGLLTDHAGDKKPRSGRGRPKVALSINPEVAVVVSTVFKANTVSSSLIDYAGQVVFEHAISTDIDLLSVDELHALLKRSVSETLAQSDCRAPLKRIAVGVQGTTDKAGDIMLWSPITRHCNLPLSNWLESDFGVPVRVWNDCDMIARSLHWQEPDKFAANFAAILLSYGVGMGLFQNGELVNGSRSSGMEFGHMTFVPGGEQCRCGKLGCIEAYAGDYAINRRAGRSNEAGTDKLDIDDIVEAARNGDETAKAALSNAGSALGTGLGNLFALTDPFPVALVGSGVKAFEFLEAPIRDALTDNVVNELAPKIEISCFPDEMPIIHNGCAISALAVVDRSLVEFERSGELDAIA